MNFDDEKDIIGNEPEIELTDDNSVSWESILDDGNDELISIKEDVVEQAPKRPEYKPKKQTSVDLGDNLELIEEEDETDDEELAKILNNDTPKYDYTQEAETKEAETEDFDLDSQLAKVNLNEANNNSNTDDFEQRQEPQPKKSNLGCLLLLLFLLLLLAGAYYAFTYIQDNEFFAKGDIQQNPTVQDNMNNINKDDIAQRQQETQNNEQNEVPVVNEEEKDTLEAQEETKDEEEEKKEVINIIPTGRSDPFMPIKKYIYVEPPKVVEVVPTVTKTINNIDYTSALIPPPPKKYGEMEEVAQRLMSIIVTGIMYDELKPSAIISYEGNDYFVQRGDKLDNYKVVDIGKDFVKIALGKNVYKAKIGEEFKITEFYGNTYISDGNSNARQYYSSEDEYNNRKENSEKYTSADDVEIHAK